MDYITLNTWDGYKKFINYYGSDYIKPFYFMLDDGIRLERAIEEKNKIIKISRIMSEIFSRYE